MDCYDNPIDWGEEYEELMKSSDPTSQLASSAMDPSFPNSNQPSDFASDLIETGVPGNGTSPLGFGQSDDTTSSALTMPETDHPFMVSTTSSQSQTSLPETTPESASTDNTAERPIDQATDAIHYGNSNFSGAEPSVTTAATLTDQGTQVPGALHGMLAGVRFGDMELFLFNPISPPKSQPDSFDFDVATDQGLAEYRFAFFDGYVVMIRIGSDTSQQTVAEFLLWLPSYRAELTALLASVNTPTEAAGAPATTMPQFHPSNVPTHDASRSPMIYPRTKDSKSSRGSTAQQEWYSAATSGYGSGSQLQMQAWPQRTNFAIPPTTTDPTMLGTSQQAMGHNLQQVPGPPSKRKRSSTSTVASAAPLSASFNSSTDFVGIDVRSNVAAHGRDIFNGKRFTLSLLNNDCGIVEEHFNTHVAEVYDAICQPADNPNQQQQKNFTAFQSKLARVEAPRETLKTLSVMIVEDLIDFHRTGTRLRGDQRSPMGRDDVMVASERMAYVKWVLKNHKKVATDLFSDGLEGIALLVATPTSLKARKEKYQKSNKTRDNKTQKLRDELAALKTWATTTPDTQPDGEYDDQARENGDDEDELLGQPSKRLRHR